MGLSGGLMTNGGGNSAVGLPFNVIGSPTLPGQVMTSVDPTQAPPTVDFEAVQQQVSGALSVVTLSGTTGTVGMPLAGKVASVATVTATGNLNASVSGMPAPGWAILMFQQDATGGRTLTVSVGATSVGVFVEPAANQWTEVRLWMIDGINLHIAVPNLVGRKFVISATNAVWPIPAAGMVTRASITAAGSGGGGGGGGSPASAVNQSGGSGGGPGWTSTQHNVDVSLLTTLNWTIGGAANGGTGGAAGGNLGGEGSYGNDTTCVGSGVSITGKGGFKGKGATAGQVTSAQVTINGNGQASGAAGPGFGGISGAAGSGQPGCYAFGDMPGGGGGGGSANATNGGGAGAAGTAIAGGTFGVTNASGTANGVTATDATVLASGGGGGGGAATAAGVGGNGGKGGAGFGVFEITAAGSIALPLLNQGTRLFNPQIASSSGTQVVYPSVTASPWGFIQAGMTNPANDGATHNRDWLMAPFGPWAAKTNKVYRLRSYNTDTNNKNGGQQLHPAASFGSPNFLGNYAKDPTSSWHVFHGFSYTFPDGTQRDDLAFPLIPSFFQIFEDFGYPYNGSPVWSICVLRGGQYPLNQLGANSATSNYIFMPSQMAPLYPTMWVAGYPSPTPIVNGDANSYDIVIEVGRSTLASTDSGITGGFLRLWYNGVRQTFAPGATEGGSSSANWTRVDAGQTLIVATLGPSDDGGPSNTPGYANWDNYWSQNQFSSGAGSGSNPITTYTYIVGTDQTKNGADPALN